MDAWDQVHFFASRENGAEGEEPSYDAVRRDFEASVQVCVCVMPEVGWGCGVGCGLGLADEANTRQVIDKIYPKIMVNCLLIRGRFSPVGRGFGRWLVGCQVSWDRGGKG